MLAVKAALAASADRDVFETELSAIGVHTPHSELILLPGVVQVRTGTEQTTLALPAHLALEEMSGHGVFQRTGQGDVEDEEDWDLLETFEED